MNRNKKIINFLCYTLLVLTIIVALIWFYQKRNINENSDNNNSGDNIDVVSYQATFKLNGANSLETSKLICVVKDNSCMITLPKATRNNGVVLGYSTNPNSKKAVYQVGEVVNLVQNLEFYVISYEIFDLNIERSNLDYLSHNNTSCRVYNQTNSCEVNVPYFNKVGYEIRGYSTSKDSLTGFIYPNSNFELTRDITLYPIYNTLSRLQKINVSQTFYVDDMIVEVEHGCSSSIYNNYLDYLRKINNNAKYLAIGSKMTFLNDQTFNNVWGSAYVGMNYGPRDLRLFDMRCSNTVINNYYATMVHELSHTWDFHYATYFKKSITEQSDVINLFNKYLNSNNRPFREYSYSNIREFFADMVRYYYFKYVDPIPEYKSLLYPDDIKFVLEKYICIANNNYVKDSCSY